MEGRHPARFINCYVDTQSCNLRCGYCYIGQRKAFDGTLFRCRYPLETMREATLAERLGGVCIFNLCAGGETLLSPDILPVIRMLLENGHNVSVVTNGTATAAFERLLELPEELLSFLYIKFSFHFLEFEKRGLTGCFFANVHRMQERGISFSIDITPCDELIPFIPKIKEMFWREMDGALPHISVARDTSSRELRLLSRLSKEEYREVWSVFDSAKFDYKIQEFLHPHREYCRAGNLSFSLDLAGGNCRICDGAPEPSKMDFYNLYERPQEAVPFVEIGHGCPTAHCYNCHALLTLGTIPELETPSYTQMLDRVERSGRHWLSERVREFYSHRLMPAKGA